MAVTDVSREVSRLMEDSSNLNRVLIHSVKKVMVIHFEGPATF